MYKHKKIFITYYDYYNTINKTRNGFKRRIGKKLEEQSEHLLCHDTVVYSVHVYEQYYYKC